MCPKAASSFASGSAGRPDPGSFEFDEISGAALAVLDPHHCLDHPRVRRWSKVHPRPRYDPHRRARGHDRPGRTSRGLGDCRQRQEERHHDPWRRPGRVHGKQRVHYSPAAGHQQSRCALPSDLLEAAPCQRRWGVIPAVFHGCGRGGTGRRATLRSLWAKARGSSSLLGRTIFPWSLLAIMFRNSARVEYFHRKVVPDDSGDAGIAAISGVFVTRVAPSLAVGASALTVAFSPSPVATRAIRALSAEIRTV